METGEGRSGRGISRRQALRALAAAGAGAALAACTRRGGRTPEPSLPPLPAKAGRLTVATWPLYIDVDEGTRLRPTVEAFTAETQIEVDYREVIKDAEAFYGKVRAAVAADEPLPWDLAVVPSRLVGRMAREGLLEPLHHDALPNFAAHAGPLFKNPSYDPRNRYSVAWQGGITGIAYDPGLTKREITKIADLFDPAFAGRVGLSSDALETMSLMLLHLGVDLEAATMADAQRAKDLLLKHRRKIRSFYDSDGSDALARGEVALGMAWSSDIFQMQADNPELIFVVPEEGAILWSDDMVVLHGAKHPTDAHAWINHYYDPKIAADVATWVNYVTPVPEARRVLHTRVAELQDPEERTELERLANSSLVFPSSASAARLHRYPVLSEAEERAWRRMFRDVVSA